MDAIVRALADQHDELDGLLLGLHGADWDRPVPDCPGWDVSDVVLHLAQTDELVPASIEHGFAAAAALIGGIPSTADGTVDDLVGLMVARQRGAPGPAVHTRWRTASAAVRDLLSHSDPKRRLPWVITDLTARTMATTRLSECWIHTCDIAGAVGAQIPATERLCHIARLAWRTIPYAFARAASPPLVGPVAAILTAPDGHRWDFGTDHPATIVTGPALDFCKVAARRLDPARSALTAEGADSSRVLALLRTYG